MAITVQCLDVCRARGMSAARPTARTVLAALACAAVAQKKPVGQVLSESIKKAFKSGSAGFVAGTMQVLAFMWLRTAMNYQYKFGGTLGETLRKLYAEGGVARLYKGLWPWAIFQAPLSRFGDVAANELVISLSTALLPQVPIAVSTWVASMAAAMWRVAITPVDTCKTILQTDGSKGMAILKEKVAKGGVTVLWSGWEGNYLANVVGNYPWFVTMNFLSNRVPVPKAKLAQLVRSAVLGAMSSSVSDVCSNGIRVVKTKKQTHADSDCSYGRAIKELVDSDGAYGLFFRGLETRIFTNVLQGAFFTIMWKYISGSA